MSVEAKDLGYIKPGDKASFTVEEIPDRVFSGTVTDFPHPLQPPHGVGSYEVIIAATNSDLSLTQGMRAHVKILVGESQGRSTKDGESRSGSQ